MNVRSASHRANVTGVDLKQWLPAQDQGVQHHHAGQHIERRRDVKHAVLEGPGTEAVDLDALRDRYATILMPSERPISAWRLSSRIALTPTCVA